MTSPLPISSSIPQLLTHFSTAVHAGFPSPAANVDHASVNLNDHLLVNPNASFLFRVRGISMSGIGVYDNDTLIIDRSITPAHNHIVLAILDDNEFTVKRLHKRGDSIQLLAEHPDFPPIILKDGQELRIWGVVTFNLHRLLNV